MNWAYGLTTIPERKNTTLVRTLASLRNAGFDKPRLFVDGACSGFEDVGGRVTYHYPRIRPMGNWVLGLGELFIRNPDADRYAMFQDDFVTCRNLREYCEKIPYPEKGYCNMFTFPNNQAKAMREKQEIGWYQSNQSGKGAIALIFSNEAVRVLLSKPPGIERIHSHLVVKVGGDKRRAYLAIDGGIVESMLQNGWKEYCHNPCLTQHIGNDSSIHRLSVEMRNVIGGTPHPSIQPTAHTFPGEDFDCMSLLK